MISLAAHRAVPEIIYRKRLANIGANVQAETKKGCLKTRAAFIQNPMGKRLAKRIYALGQT
jgi:hypothetical protein